MRCVFGAQNYERGYRRIDLVFIGFAHTVVAYDLLGVSRCRGRIQKMLIVWNQRTKTLEIEYIVLLLSNRSNWNLQRKIKMLVAP